MSLSAFNDQRALFKAYDIRGERKLFTMDFVIALSDTLADYYIQQGATQIVIGFDTRHFSEAIAKQLATSFQTKAVEVIWLGLVTTPIMAFWANNYQGHGVIATASHSEPHINGIKWLIDKESPSREQIQHLYQCLFNHSNNFNHSYTADNLNNLIANNPNHIETNKTLNQHKNTKSTQDKSLAKVQSLSKLVHLSQSDIINGYVNQAVAAIDTINGFKLSTKTDAHTTSVSTRPSFKIVIDCLNGATGQFVEPFFTSHRNLCSELIILNATADGNFPKGNPDPMEHNRLQELTAAVISNNADMGLSFDGDGDRLMVVDNKGKPLVADHLLYLLSRIAVEDHIAMGDCGESSLCNSNRCTPTVVFDVKCSHYLSGLIEEMGAISQMSKTGSSILRRTLQSKQNATNTHILFAGELSGHFIFNDGHFLLHDDAMYAGLRLLNWLQYQSITLNEIIATLPQAVSTPDIYLPLSDYSYSVTPDTKASSVDKNSQPILNKLTMLCSKLRINSKDFPIPLPADAQLTFIDGLRLDFRHGFGIIRSSNTSNSLTVRFAGDTLSDLEKIQGYFVKLCQSISQDLAKQVANIQVKQ
ncbi:phosphomannomutase/phosphoglucomutase [Psychrobacter sp.]|uniref:phosphomannomutase/phosphoglucomutase n=1 Tax=Psychrobacter sp. TaxID=56811 RepID=UPI0025E8949E|nr:phosphomannomutase/phosphoglucomutase [Psychrobacter sp.]